MTNHILKNESKMLHTLFQKLDQLRELNHIFAQHVDTVIATHCKIANLQNNCLIVIVDSGNWATQLRFHIPTLIQKMRQHPSLENLKAICCKTRPDPMLQKIKKKRHSVAMMPVSQSTAKLILESANTIQDEKLRAILKRIARRSIDG